jgi:signal transduction histidine kinase
MLDSTQRNNIVAKRVAIILAFLSFVLLLILTLSFGINVNSPIILAIGIFCLITRYGLDHGFSKSGRILLCIVPPLVAVAAAILAKAYSQSFTDILYYDTRFVLILCGIVPCLVFDTSDHFGLYGSLSVIFLCLVLFDPIHEIFHLGYFQRGFKSHSYYYINYIALITFFGISTGAIVLKRVIEKTTNENFAANKKLSNALRNLEATNEEIIAQKEELSISQEQLISANSVIEKQKIELQNQVVQVNSSLALANKELIANNNDLRQFSYTISHNLRGPIASLLGLANLASMSGELERESESMKIISRMKSSAQDLDGIISDLNKILDMKTSVQQSRQHVAFIDEWNEIQQLLGISEIQRIESFKIDFSLVPLVYSVKSMINSIMFHLVSNTLKFKAFDRNLMAELRTYRSGDYTVLEVSDNGLGIDLSIFKDDVFKMYKRFHIHTEGKGLGLYLTKFQAELLNGFVEIESKMNYGSTFKVYIRNAGT